MRKMMRRVLLCALAAGCFWCGTVAAQRGRLDRELIGIQVEGNSDRFRDRQMTLAVRETLAGSLRNAMAEAVDGEKAKEYIAENIEKLQKAAQEQLKALGCEETVKVDLTKAAFPGEGRIPTGIYSVLRATIGAGEGEEQTGLLFPEDSTAVFAAEGDSFLAAKERETRLFILEKLGELENYLKNSERYLFFGRKLWYDWIIKGRG